MYLRTFHITVYSLFLALLLTSLCGCDSAPESPAQSSTEEAPDTQTATTGTQSDDAEEAYDIETRLGQSITDPFSDNNRAIRVLVSYNDTNFFFADGHPRGLEYELMHNFEKFLNKGKVPANKRKHIVFIAVPFSQLLPLLLDGKGDIAAAGLTVTDAREAQIAFTRPYRNNVREVLVRSKASEPVASLEKISGKRIYVVRASSYAAHLETLNKRFADQDIEPVDIVQAGSSLAAEDLLQMVNADILQYTVVDDHVASLWSQVLDNIQIEDAVSIHEGGALAWAVRKDNPALLSKLNEYLKDHGQGTLLGNILFKRYYKNTDWIENPLTDEYKDKLEALRPLFEKYGQQYDFDWSLLAALAFQESHFNQKRRSHAGAVGIMQIKPSTAADKNVGIKGVAKSSGKNVHAATKYLAFLRDRYFSDANIADRFRVDFTLAAYNAGPRRVQSLRSQATKAGLDPDQWFFNVENIAQKKIGRETVDYVANVHKYQITFSAMDKLLAAREAASNALREKAQQTSEP